MFFNPIYKHNPHFVSSSEYSGEWREKPRRKMDESWRMRMGLTPGLPRRRSMEDRSSSRTRRSIFAGAAEPEALDPDDFADVFGGPPRSLLAHKFSRSNSFYEEIFRPPEFAFPAPTKGGRSLPVFRIPAKNEAFYSDIFGSDDERRSRQRSGPQSKAKSKSNSSSALSSEELSPLRPAIGDDVALSAFASKLSSLMGILRLLSDCYRPINVPCRWNSTTMMPGEHPVKQGGALFSCNNQSFEIHYQENEYKENFKSSHFGFSRRVSSPETISLESNSYQSMKASADDWELSSPFSAVSGLCQEPEAKSLVHDHMLPELVIEQDDDEVMSSYVIEVNSNFREESCGTADIDEAIAWAKEKFQSRNSDEESSLRNEDNEQTTGVEGRSDAGESHDDGIGKASSKVQTETEKLDRDIRLWSSGKETDIRLLLSTLHHILWPESGWYAVPLPNLIESSQVKKAYQKARLCLHPDKLQQRGATLLQKYVAEKAFSILQVKQSWLELVFDTRCEQSWALIDNPPEALFWDFEFMQDKVKNWDEISFDVRGEDFGAHAKDSGQVLFLKAHGEKEGDDGVNGLQGSSAKIRVLGQCFTCINTHYLKAENFLFEFKGEFGLGWGIKGVALKDTFGFRCHMKD
ncbi:Auxilin-related protein 2, partial [Mucuna pruriens]